MYKTQKEQLLKSFEIGYNITNIKGSDSTPGANESEFNCSKMFLCQQPEISAPLSLLINLFIGVVWTWIASLIIRSGVV